MVIPAVKRTEELLLTNSVVVSGFLDSLIPALLEVMNTQEKDVERPVRQLVALKVMKMMTDLPLATVFKYTNRVAKGLLPLLDDEQRVIREYAARVRNLWLMIH